MREIKFKVWDLENKKFVHYRNMNREIKKYLFFTGSYEVLLHQERFLFLQYTGLWDKHGTELYEGDIVKGTAIEREGGFDYLGVVEFETQNNVHGYHVREPFRNGSAGAWGLSQLQTRISLNHITGEIIGNIYENIELLEEVK